MSRVILAAPIAGWLTSLREVPDPVFSEEMMGVGFAIDPTDGIVAAPCDAQVLLVAPTKHSVTLITDEGAELLIHIGIETVALQGRGFEAHVSDGQRVAAGDRLISFDLDIVGLEARSLVTPILLTNPEGFRLTVEPLDRLVEQGEAVASIDGAAASAAEVIGGHADRREAVIRFEHGLHARPAARIADTAKRFSSEITISFGAKNASARSPVAVMALNVRKDDRVELSAIGDDGAEAVAAIVDLLNEGENTKRTRAAPAKAERTLSHNEIAGVCALPGVAVGTAVRWRRQMNDVADEGLGVDHERAALSEARAVVRARLKAAALIGGPAAAIAAAHSSLLDDEELNAAALGQIERGKRAARA